MGLNRNVGGFIGTTGFSGMITGDDNTQNFIITHSLGSRAVQVEVFEDFGNYNKVTVDTELTSTDSVTIKFPALAVPGVGENYKVNIIKVV